MITSAIPVNVGERLIGLVTSREEIPGLLLVPTEIFCLCFVFTKSQPTLDMILVLSFFSCIAA